MIGMGNPEAIKADAIALRDRINEIKADVDDVDDRLNDAMARLSDQRQALWARGDQIANARVTLFAMSRSNRQLISRIDEWLGQE
jgi:hypothetical protein